MTKIFEALEQADNEKKYSGNLSVISTPEDNEINISFESIMPKLAVLYQKIITLLPDSKSRIIQFLSTADDEGTSILVREFAKFSALKLKRKVLLVDAGINASSNQADYFKVRLSKNLEKPESYTKIGDSSLFLSKMHIDFAFSQAHSDASPVKTIFDKLQQNFDLILIDSPSTASCPDTLMLSGNVDGIVLIVEAEKYRWQVIDKTKKSILSQGGNILGVILNNRRYPIPDFIYNRI